MSEEISAPWAVRDIGYSTDIGKIISLNPFLVRCTERHSSERYSPQLWETKYVKLFDDPVKAIAYFLVHQSSDGTGYTKEYFTESFLKDFPSERKNLIGRIKSLEKPAVNKPNQSAPPSQSIRMSMTKWD